MGFFRFWETKVIIFNYFGSPGAPFRGSGPISTIFGFVVILGTFRDEKVIPFWDQNLTTHPLLGVLDFSCFLEYLLSVFLDFGWPEDPF